MPNYVLRFETHVVPGEQGSKPVEFKYAIRRASDNQIVFRTETKELADKLMVRLRRKRAA